MTLRKTFWLLIALTVLVSAIAGCEIQFDEGRSTDEADSQLKKCEGDDCPLSVPKQFGPVGMMELPLEMREANYSSGSCVHASMVTVLRWQGEEELARWWRHNYRGGEYSHHLIDKAEQAGLSYAYTNNGDETFLEWTSRTRRGAVIFYYTNHAICFCGYENGSAVLLDNNRVSQRIEVPKATFIQNWKLYGGFALTPVLSPSPPQPHI